MNLSPEASARLASPIVAAAMVLLAGLTRETVLAHAAEFGAADADGYAQSTGANAGAMWLSGEIAAYVGGGYPMGRTEQPVPPLVLAPLHYACAAARRRAHEALVYVIREATPEPNPIDAQDEAREAEAWA